MKILGRRIESGEVQSALRSHENIKQSCVVSETNEDGSTRLIAYYIASNFGSTGTQLRDFLVESLPQNKIPELFIPVNSLPLKADGEVDLEALPAPSIMVRNDPAPAATPVQLERAIIAIWRKFLVADQIGPADNFFDLGGDSLLLGRVHTILQKELRVKIPITALFEFPTVRSLAHYLDGQVAPDALFSEAQQRAQRQRAAFARQRDRRMGGGS